jgi:hypothetical protein
MLTILYLSIGEGIDNRLKVKSPEVETPGRTNMNMKKLSSKACVKIT